MYALYSREVSEELPLTTAEPRPEEELSIRTLPTTGRELVLTPTTSTRPHPVATDYKPRRRGGRTGSRVPVSEERKLFNFSTETKGTVLTRQGEPAPFLLRVANIKNGPVHGLSS
jgi:hypothetical protein